MNTYKVTVSILFGLIGFILNFNSIQFSFPPYVAVILMGLLFPLLITFAWGWRYGLISAIIGCQSMWWLWLPSNGYAVIFVVPPFTAWILWHGYFADLRRRSGCNQWWMNPYVVEIPFRILSTINLYTLGRWAITLNPPSWANTASAVIPMEFTHFVVVKQCIIAYILIILANAIMYLDPVRRFFRLQKSISDPRLYYTYTSAIILGGILILSFVGESHIWSLWGSEFQYAVRILGSVLLLMVGIFCTYKAANVFAKMKTEELIDAEKVLKESENKYRLLADNTLDVIWTMGLDLKFIYVNPFIFNMLGFTPEEWIGSTLPEHCTPEQMRMTQKLIVREVEAEEKHRWVVFECGYFHKNGNLVPCEVNARILFDENGTPTSMQGTTKDITDRKAAEKRLNRTMEELKRSNSDLEQFAYVSSHDLQEPLRMISGYVDLIRRKYRGKLDSDMDSYIEFVIGGVNRMQLLIDDLLKYSRLGTLANPLVSTDCEAVLGDSLSNLKISIDEIGAVVTHDTLPVVMADGSQLTQVFQNLISNAIKFKGVESPQIHISVEKKGKMWVFSVVDNGIGIEPEFFDRIFVIFNRLHSKGEYSGTGIGLSICKKIVERHGGKIWVESSGVGSTFYFTIQGI